MNDEKKLSALGVVVPDDDRDPTVSSSRNSLKQLEPGIKYYIKCVLEDIQQISSICAAEVRAMDSMSVESIDDEKKVLRVISDAGESLKLVDASRMKATGLWRGVVTLFNDRYGNLIKPLKESRDALKGRCANWRLTEDLRIRAENAKHQAKEQRLREEQLEQLRAEAGVPKEMLGIIDEPIPVVPRESATKKMTGGHMRDNWKVEVIDATKVPREFLCVDMKKVNAHKVRHHDALIIPGIRIWNEPTVVAR